MDFDFLGDIDATQADPETDQEVEDWRDKRI
jgi:hypothetical protein